MALWDTVRGWFGAKQTQPPPVELPVPVPAPVPVPVPAPAGTGQRAEPRAEPSLPLQRNAELEAVIARDPLAVEPYLVYADWLSERDDPRGELIHLEARRNSATTVSDLDEIKRRSDELLKLHPQHLLGPARGHDVDLHLGFVRRLGDCKELDSILAADHPATRFLDAIVGSDYELERVREVVNDRARVVGDNDLEIELWQPLVGDVFVERDGPLSGVGVWLELPKFCWGDHVSRTLLEWPGGRREWWWGNGAEFTEDSLSDYLPYSGRAWVPAWVGEATLRMTMRFRVGERTLWVEGSARVDGADGKTHILMRLSTPDTRPPFVARPARLGGRPDELPTAERFEDELDERLVDPRSIGDGGRHYGAGSPVHHAQLGRTAWVVCASNPHGDDSGVTLIGWLDRDGAHGTIAVPDYGRNFMSGFGFCKIQDDGKILARASRWWLADPTTGEASDLGEQP